MNWSCKMPWRTSLYIDNGNLYWRVIKALPSWETSLRGELTKTSIKYNTLTYSFPASPSFSSWKAQHSCHRHSWPHSKGSVSFFGSRQLVVAKRTGGRALISLRALSKSFPSFRIRDVALIVPHLMYADCNVCTFYTLDSMLTPYSNYIQL